MRDWTDWIKGRIRALLGILLLSICLTVGLGAYWFNQILHDLDRNARQKTEQLLGIQNALRDAVFTLAYQTQEWKDMLLRAHDPSLLSRHRQGFEHEHEHLKTVLQQAEEKLSAAGLDTSKIRAIRQQSSSLMEEYVVASAYLDFNRPLSFRNADSLVRGKDRELRANLQRLTEEVNVQVSARMMTLGVADSTSMQRYYLIGLLGILLPLLSSILFYVIYRTLNKIIQREKLALAGMAHCTEGMIITDEKGNICYVNGAFERNTGYSRSEIIGRNPRMFKSGKTLPETYVAMWNKLKQGFAWQGELINLRKDGSEYAELITISPVRLSNDRVTHYLAVQHDITERLACEEKNRYQAQHDALTNLPNRVLLEDRMEQAIKNAERNDEQFALMFLDLDGFKQVNDTLGHHIGDQLLKMVAHRLVKSVRSSDTVSRLGGDEFVMLLSPVGGMPEVEAVAAKIVQAVSEHYPMEGNHQPLVTSVSMGIAIYPAHGENAEDITRNADIAMYHAKKHGRNRYQLFLPEMAG